MYPVYSGGICPDPSKWPTSTLFLYSSSSACLSLLHPLFPANFLLLQLDSFPTIEIHNFTSPVNHIIQSFTLKKWLNGKLKLVFSSTISMGNIFGLKCFSVLQFFSLSKYLFQIILSFCIFAFCSVSRKAEIKTSAVSPGAQDPLPSSLLQNYVLEVVGLAPFSCLMWTGTILSSWLCSGQIVSIGLT